MASLTFGLSSFSTFGRDLGPDGLIPVRHSAEYFALGGEATKAASSASIFWSATIVFGAPVDSQTLIDGRLRSPGGD